LGYNKDYFVFYSSVDSYSTYTWQLLYKSRTRTRIKTFF